MIQFFNFQRKGSGKNPGRSAAAKQVRDDGKMPFLDLFDQFLHQYRLPADRDLDRLFKKICYSGQGGNDDNRLFFRFFLIMSTTFVMAEASLTEVPPNFMMIMVDSLPV